MEIGENRKQEWNLSNRKFLAVGAFRSDTKADKAVKKRNLTDPCPPRRRLPTLANGIRYPKAKWCFLARHDKIPPSPLRCKFCCEVFTLGCIMFASRQFDGCVS